MICCAYAEKRENKIMNETKQLKTLYGDGKHDDSDALQAWLNGEPVAFTDGTLVGELLTNLKFKMSNHLVDNRLRNNKSEVKECAFIG